MPGWSNSAKYSATACRPRDIRSTPARICASEVAKESRRYPGCPNADPGTTATPCSSRSTWESFTSSGTRPRYAETSQNR